jgi:hypothetical protein
MEKKGSTIETCKLLVIWTKDSLVAYVRMMELMLLVRRMSKDPLAVRTMRKDPFAPRISLMTS